MSHCNISIVSHCNSHFCLQTNDIRLVELSHRESKQTKWDNTSDMDLTKCDSMEFGCCPNVVLPELPFQSSRPKVVVPKLSSQSCRPKVVIPKFTSQSCCPKVVIQKLPSQSCCFKVAVPKLLSQSRCPRVFVSEFLSHSVPKVSSRCP